MIATLLLGCRQGDAPPDPGSLFDDVPFVLEPTTTSDQVDLDGVTSAAQTAVDLVAHLDPDPILDAYRDLAAGADAKCPSEYASDTLYYWLDSCTSDDGTKFEGYGLDDAVTVDDGAGGTYDVTATGGSGHIEAKDGTFLDLDGYVQRIDDESDGVVSSTLVMTGKFATNHPLADGTWVSDGIRPNLTVSEYKVLGKRVLVAAVGALDQLGGDDPAVAFDQAAILDPSIGYGGCALEPSGTVSVRLPTGDWVDIVFDPVLHDDGLVTVDDADCDGCGEAWHRADLLGQVCLDFDSWLKSI